MTKLGNVECLSTGKVGRLIRDNDQPIVEWSDGSRTVERWGVLRRTEAEIVAAECSATSDTFSELYERALEALSDMSPFQRACTEPFVNHVFGEEKNVYADMLEWRANHSAGVLQPVEFALTFEEPAQLQSMAESVPLALQDESA